MSLFSTPKAPEEDPAVKAARQRQQVQSENALTSSIQDDLRRQMQVRLQRFGLVGGNPGGSSLTSGFIRSI